RTQLGAHAFDLRTSRRGALLDVLLCRTDTLLRRLPNLFDGGIALGVPLLQLLVTGLKDRGLGITQLLLVRGGLGFGRGDCASRLFNCPGGAGTALSKNAIQRTPDQQSVGDD